MVQRTSLYLLFGLLLGNLGCMKKQLREPKPETCNAYGEFRLNESQAKGLSQAKKQQMQQEAQVAFQQALSLDPDNTEAILGLAKSQLTGGSTDGAIKILNAAVQKSPENPAFWLLMGRCYGRKKEWSQAVQSLKEANRYAPQDRTVLRELGYTLARAGHIDEGLGYLEQMMPKDQANYNIARMLEHIGRADLSPEYLQVALQHNPQNAKALAMMEQLHGQQQQQSDVVPVSYPQYQQ